jgi:hypothetical protein
MATTTHQFTCEWCQKYVALTGRAASKAKRRKQRFCSSKCYRESLSRKRTSVSLVTLTKSGGLLTSKAEFSQIFRVSLMAMK